MKIKALLATLVGAIALQGAMAGSQWCAPSPAKGCATDCCPDIGGQVTVGYNTDYVWKGVRWARDSVWADVNYTFENLPLSPNIGIWHLSSLGSANFNTTTGAVTGNGSDAYGDETNIYASIVLPSLLGFDHSLGYVYNLFPTQRGPQGPLGDSFQRLQFNASRELFGGIGFNYLAEWYFGADTRVGGVDDHLSAWFHTLSIGKSFCITDCISLDLSGEVSYNDGLWSGLNLGDTGSGWNNYMLKAALPIALNCRATLTPYIAYNGTPDGWTGDGLNTGLFGAGQNPNFNDLFYGGVSLGINF